LNKFHFNSLYEILRTSDKGMLHIERFYEEKLTVADLKDRMSIIEYFIRVI
jgi:hypothetical protein